MEDETLNEYWDVALGETFWVISDTHFGHTNIAEYIPVRKRCLYEVENDLDECLIKKWNSLIKPNDIVFHLGDFGLINNAKIEDIISRLHGRIILIPGNHDLSRLSLYRRLLRDVVSRKIVVIDKLSHLAWKITFDDKRIGGIVLRDENCIVLFTHSPMMPEPNYATKLNDIMLSVFLDLDCDFNVHGHIHGFSLDNPILINVAIEQTGLRPVLFAKKEDPAI